MISFPFDSAVTYDADGNPIFDRAVNSEILAGYFHLMYTDGIFPEPSTALQVTVSEQDMSVVVLPGNINIQGRLGMETADRMLVFEASGTVYDRIDAVVARLNTNYNYRKIDLYVVKGEEASLPVAPELKRSGGIYELRLANVFIPKNSTAVSAERITDTRLITEECGIVSANPQKIDTTKWFDQYQAELADFKKVREQDFLEWQQSEKNEMERYFSTMQVLIETWFENMQEQLTDDAAVNLQKQIDDMKGFYIDENHKLHIPVGASDVIDHKIILYLEEE